MEILQTTKVSKKKLKNGNGHLDAKKIKWQELPYDEMIKLVQTLVGPRPDLPQDLPHLSWTPQAERVLAERYFLKSEDGEILEDTPQMCWRVAWELASAEVKYGKSREQILEQAKDYYRLMIDREFLPNSPTLMNAGKGNGLQYSACYVLPVEDSLSGIFDGIKYQAIVHQSGGGTGFSFSRLRPAGSRVKSTRGVASGPVSFMKVYNEATQQIKQGGMRRGANMGILRVDHPDVMEFIHCKDDGVSVTNFNISVTVTDKFMDALAKGEEYELYEPHTGKVAGKLSAKLVWDEIAKGAWTTGDPGVIFIDRINQSPANPIRKEGWEVESTNPCVTGDTLVSTSEGLKRIKDLYKDKTPVNVLVDGRLGNEKFYSVSQVIKTGIKGVYKLTTKSGYEVKLTKNHKIYTKRGWVEAGDLNEGDKIYISNKKGNFGNYGTRDEGQILGWLVGDGTMKASEAVLSFFGAEKQELSPKYAQMVSNLVNSGNYSEVHRRLGFSSVKGRDEDRIKSTRLWKYAFEHGIQPGNKLVVPEYILYGNEDMQSGFLQALFTADGHVEGNHNIGVRVRLTSISLSLLKDVQKVLLNFGIASKIYSQRRKEQMRSLPNGKGGYKDYLCREYHDLTISRDNLWRFAKEIGFLVSYKNAKLLDVLREYEEGPYSEEFTTSFKSLEYHGKEVVYDLTEPVTHSFVANGIVSHNCGEQPLYPFDACNLGSIFLGYFVTEEKKVNWKKLKDITHEAVRLLDSVIEMNPFPLPQINDTVRKIRRIGLGVGGWADMLVMMGIGYNSEEALTLAEEVMKFINVEGHKASQQLAKERGEFPMWKYSVYATDAPIRNSTVTTIAPTGSIGILAGASGGIEPKFAIAYQHIVKSENRTLTFVDEMFEQQAKERGIWSEELKTKLADHGTVHDLTEVPEDMRKVWVTAHEIEPEWHVRMQAAFQKYTDNAVSKTINLPNSATVEDIQNAYMLAWETECRGITVFRDGCKNEQVLNVGTKNEDKKKEEAKIEMLTEPIKERPAKVLGATYRVDTPVGIAFITINEDEEGHPLELFVNVGKAGSDVTAMAEALGRTISTSLRFRGGLSAKDRADEIAKQLAGIGGRRSVGFGPNRILSLPDAVAYALSIHFGFHINGWNKQIQTQQLAIDGTAVPTDKVIATAPTKKLGDICPKCGEAAFVFEEGCKKCYSCGHSEC